MSIAEKLEKFHKNRIKNIKNMKNGTERDLAIGSLVADLGNRAINGVSKVLNISRNKVKSCYEKFVYGIQISIEFRGRKKVEVQFPNLINDIEIIIENFKNADSHFKSKLTYISIDPNSIINILIKDIPMDNKQDYDILGFIYEYLISNFAANAGKKAGEFYTPHEVSLLMSEIIAEHLKDREKIEIYDPTSGSGSLLINIGKTASKYIKEENKIKYYAQELKQNTYNLTRMNLIMRGILPDNIVTRNGDTLEDDWPYFDE